MGCLTAKASGEIASFMTPAKTNIKSLKVHFSPKQLGTGDPSPENVREIEGWDGVEVHEYNSDFKFIPIVKSGTYLGVTWTINDSGLVIAEGTPTSWSNCLIGYIKVNGDETIQGFIYGSLNNVTISKPKLYDSDDKEISFSASDNILLHGLDLSQYKDVKKVGIVLKRNTNNIYMSGSCYVVVKKIENINDIHKATISINWTKNIKQWTYTDTTIDDSYSSNNFNGYGNGRWDNVIADIPSEWFGKELTYSAYIERSSSPLNEYDDVRVWCYGDSTTLFDAKTAQRIYTAGESGRSWVTFTIPEGTTKIGLGLYLSKGSRAYNPQLEYGSEPTEYQPYVGTIYGGYVDLISGELKNTYGIYTFEEKGDYEYRAGSVTYVIPTVLDMKIGDFYTDQYVVCDRAKKVLNRTTTVNNELQIKIGNNNNRAYLYNTVRTIGIDNETDFRQWIKDNPISFTYPLLEPVVYQLTPTQLSSFIGQNNFWSNADYVEVEYDLIETFDIQKAKRKIIMSQPHVESASNSPSSPQVIKFKTDMKAPLKQCVVSFMPIQEGSGDPSPTNIRPIKGWNGITLKHTGINMLQCNSPSYYIDATNNGITSQSSRNADNEIIGIDFNGTTTSTNIFRNLNYNPNDSGAVTMPRGLMGLTGYSDQVYVIPMGNGNAPRTTDGRYWTGANTNSENGWNVWSVDSSETYNGLWVRTQVFPRESNVNVDTTVYPMMCLAEDVGCEFEPYKGETFNVDWTDDAGTVYGGYIDLVSGILTITVKCIDMGTGDWHYATQSSVPHFYCFLNDKLYSQNEYIPCWCSCYNFWGNGISSVIYSGFADKEFGAQVTNGMIRLRDDSITDVTTFKESVSGQMLAYPLIEPITYQLTPQQIIAFKGQNNIWANTNKLTQIKYWNHKKSDSTGVIYEAENLAFDGTNYIDTGVYLFSEENINRDFEVVIEDLYGDYETGSRTIVCAKYDSEAIGFLIRLNDSTSITYNGTISMKASYNNNITIRRINGVITCEGSIINNPRVKFTNTIHNHPLVLGCALQDDGTPFRYATGTIGHITVKWL